jgi:hypothetical protein
MYRRLCWWSLIASTIVTLVWSGLGGPAAGAAIPKVHITKVAFAGSSVAPVITITGSGFGNKPLADPRISPATAGGKYRSACYTQHVQGNGKDGNDFGPIALGVGWGSKPSKGYNAGVYVPGSYLDCIGIVIESYSSTKIVVQLGCQYVLYGRVAAGDYFLVEVGGHTSSGRVAYP